MPCPAQAELALPDLQHPGVGKLPKNPAGWTNKGKKGENKNRRSILCGVASLSKDKIQVPSASIFTFCVFLPAYF